MTSVNIVGCVFPIEESRITEDSFEQMEHFGNV